MEMTAEYILWIGNPYDVIGDIQSNYKMSDACGLSGVDQWTYLYD